MARRSDTAPIITFDANGVMHIDPSVGPEMVQFLKDCVYHEDCLEKFAKFFLKASFKKPFTKFRKECARRISDPSIPYNWNMAHRSFGKSTLIWAELIRELCFRLSPFIVYASSEIHLAERRTEAVKRALITNPRIRKYFGAMNPEYMDGMREVFGAKAWKLADPVTNITFAYVVPKSDGTAVNGLLEYIGDAQVRPNTIVCDDMTDRFRVDDDVYRDSHKNWFYGTLMPCVENEEQPDPKTKRWPGIKRGERAPYRFIVTDTYKHSDALIENLAEDPDWIGSRYAMAEEKEPGKIVSLVEYMSDEQVQALYDRHARKGKEELFFREYCCSAGHSAENGFPKEHQYYREEELNLNNDPQVVKFLIMDPARTKSARADYTAILAVAIDCIRAKVWLRRMVHARLGQDEMLQALWELSVDLNTDIIGVEDAGLNDHIKGPLDRYFTSKGRRVEWMWLPTSRKYIESEGERRNIKEARASSALWMYRPMEPHHPKGHVWHEECMRDGPLERYQRSYPECKRWDAMDTLGHVDYMMRMLGLTFEDVTVAYNDRGERYDEWDEILKEDQVRLLSA